jgi:HK97 family phage major capsid protein
MDEKELKALMDGIAAANGEAIKLSVEKEVKSATKGLLTLEELNKRMETLGLKEDAITKLVKAVEDQGLELKKLMESGKEKYEDLEHFISKNAEAIKSVDKSNGEKLRLKVPKTLVTQSSVTNNTMGYRVPGIGQLPVRGAVLLETFRRLGSVVQLSEQEVAESNGVIRYMDQNAITRGAAPVAESATKPESAISWIERTIAMEYIADTIPVTRQAWRRLGFIRGEIDRLLRMNVELAIDAQLYNGTGVSPQLKGLTVSAPNLTVADLSTLTGTVAAANLFDLIAALKVFITSGSAGTGKQRKYMPQAILVPPALALQAKRTKGSDSHYATPNFVSPDGRFVDGIEIIEVPGMAANTAIIGDFRYLTVYEEEAYTVEMGLVNDQFIKNQWTIRAEQALAQLVRTVDEDAFLEVTDVAAAIAQITT